MNERIKQIAEESGLKVESWMTNPPTPFQILGSTEDFEKFTELIVRECAHIGFNAAYPENGVEVSLAIKTHFGVE